MSWLQFRLETDSGLVPFCEAALVELGASAVTLEDNADEPLFAHAQSTDTVWRNTRVSGLFPADTDVASLWAALPEDLRTRCTWRAEILEDKDWEREWMRRYAPRQFGDALWLCPSWHTPPNPTAVNIMLDPGMAFGTGTHPTTGLCLEHLADLDLAGEQVIDFGCGSGILAVAALLLGAGEAVAVDIDPQALIATRANAERNDIPMERITVCAPENLSGNEQADLVIANILAGPLCELAPRLCAMLRPGGRIMLAGILSEQVAQLQAHYAVNLDLVREREGWVLLEGRRA